MARLRSAVITIRVSPDERSRFGAAADIDGGLDLSAWARRTMILAANRLLGTATTPAQPSPGVTVRALLERFCAEYTNPRVQCIDAYRYDAKCLIDRHVLPALGNRDAETLTPADVAALRDAVLASRSRQTVRHMLNRLARAYRWGMAQQIVLRADNPADAVDRPPDDCRGEPIRPEEYLNSGEIRALLAWTAQHRPDDLAWYSVAIHCGLRLGELARLCHRDRVGQTLHVARGKTGRARVVPIPDDCLPHLPQPGRADSLLLPGPGGRQRNRGTVGKRWHEAARAAGIKDIPFHGLRHTFASHLAMAGVPMLTIARLLGHTRMETTMRYAHLAPDYLQEAVNRPRLVQIKPA